MPLIEDGGGALRRVPGGKKERRGAVCGGPKEQREGIQPQRVVHVEERRSVSQEKERGKRRTKIR